MTNWNLDDGRTIVLLTPDEFQRVPEGVTFYDIFGRAAVKGTDYIDQDTRMGHLAYGVLEEQWNG